MRYIVSGYRRSGTSAMMLALTQGMTIKRQVQWNPHAEELNVALDGYRPNPGPLLEVGQNHYIDPPRLRELLVDNCLIKIFYDGLPYLPATDDYKIIFMFRDPVEIAASLNVTEQHLVAQGVLRPEPGDFACPFDVYQPFDQANIEHVYAICEQRRDIELFPVQFQNLIDQPVAVFGDLAFKGIPINIEKAAATINPAYHRVRNAPGP